MGLVFRFIEFGVEDRRSSQRAYHSLCLVNLHCMSVWEDRRSLQRAYRRCLMQS
jgi:hypothetical protein